MLNEKGNCTYVTLSSCYHEWGLVVICAACIDISSIFNQTTQNLTRGIRTTEGIVRGCFTTFVLKTDISSMFNKKVTALMWPFLAANIRRVWSLSLQPALTSAPFSIQQLKISHGASEPRTAWWTAVLQKLSGRLTSAPCSLRKVTASMWPFSAATISGVISPLKNPLMLVMFLIRVFQNKRFNRFLRFFASLINNDGTLRKCYLFSYRYKNFCDIGIYLKPHFYEKSHDRFFPNFSK